MNPLPPHIPPPPELILIDNSMGSITHNEMRLQAMLNRKDKMRRQTIPELILEVVETKKQIKKIINEYKATYEQDYTLQTLYYQLNDIELEIWTLSYNVPLK